MDNAATRLIKKTLSPLLLEVEGVNGVGLAGENQIMVYVIKDTPEVRNNIKVVFDTQAPGVTYSVNEIGVITAGPAYE